MSSAGAALQRRGENLREGRWGEDGGRASLGEVWTGGGSERVGLFGTFVSLGTAANDRACAFTHVRGHCVNGRVNGVDADLCQRTWAFIEPGTGRLVNTGSPSSVCSIQPGIKLQ